MLLLYLTLVVHIVLGYNHREDKVFYNEDDAPFHFKWFMKTHNKTYHSEMEEATRLEIFKENLININELNKQHSYCTYGINQFTDLTPEEFLMLHNTGLDIELGYGQGVCKDLSGSDLSSGTAPAAFDWRQTIKIQIKDQQTCGSCWAFSATGNVEAQYAIKHQQFISLSEQQLVDCDTNQNDGCKNGNPTIALGYLIQAGGQESDNAYPYVNEKRTCQFTPSKAEVRVTDCISFNFDNEDMIKEALVKYGPLIAAVDATSFHGYTGGVNPCTFQALGHAVMIVGYGTDDASGKDFWIIKNSWGSQWGENGYIRIQRNINACGILNNIIATSVIA